MPPRDLSPQVDFKSTSAPVPSYRYARIQLNNLPSGSVSFQPSSSTQIEWKLSAGTVFNLARSFISYQYSVPALASNYACVFANGCDLGQWMFFGTGAGTPLCDLYYNGQYKNVALPLRTKLENFLSNDQLTHFYPCNQLNTSNILPFSRDGLLLGADNASTSSYIEQQYLEISPVVNTAVQVNRYLPLSSFPDTVPGQDKDVVYGTDMYLRFQTSWLNRMFFFTTTPANPNLIANFTAPSASLTCSNMVLYLAIEENIEIQRSLLESLSKGSIKYSIPYTYTYRINTAAQSSNANLSFTLTKGYGRAVKRLLIAPFSGSEGNVQAWDHSNVNGTKMSTIQTAMDGRPLTDYILQCYNPNSAVIPTGTSWAAATTFPWGDDWREAQKYIRGSCILNYPMYQTNWFYANSWGQPCMDSPDCEEPSLAQLDSGFDLLASGDHTYNIQAQTPAVSGASTNNNYAVGLVIYVFATFLRTLVVKPDGIELLP